MMEAEAIVPQVQRARASGEPVTRAGAGDRAWRRIQRDNAQKAYILENIHSPVATFCPQGRVRWVNRGLERLLGLGVDQLRGRTYESLVGGCEENARSLRRLHRASLRGEPAFDLEFRLQHGAGRRVWLAVDVHPLFDDGVLSRYAVTGFDITERKRNDTLKTDFVSLVGHELRTPLTVVSGALEAMAAGLTGAVEPTMRELIDMGQRNCTRLRRLIENLLDVNRIETGAVVYQLQHLPVRDAVEHVARVLALEVDQAGLALDLDGVDRQSVVLADPARFEQVLGQLLGNAMKFSGPGKVIEVRSATSAAGRIRISVVDRGPGIHPDFAPKVFEKFARDPQVLASGIEGFGLGLSIARALVASMNGRIGYHANAGPGCEFWFELPAIATETGDPGSAGEEKMS
ncbi:MAG: PAS domain-containing sensor histidine kinase [Burkholderiaceae bacterium]